MDVIFKVIFRCRQLEKHSSFTVKLWVSLSDTSRGSKKRPRNIFLARRQYDCIFTGWQNHKQLGGYNIETFDSTLKHTICIADSTLLSVWSPSCIFISSGQLVLPVSLARYSTRAVLPDPTGPCNSTGHPAATVSARRRRFLRVDPTSTRESVLLCSACR